VGPGNYYFVEGILMGDGRAPIGQLLSFLPSIAPEIEEEVAFISEV
jgi:hypothetical protein